LREIKPKEAPKKQHKTCEQIMVSALYRAGKCGMTWKQAVGMAYGMAKSQGTTMRIPREIKVAGQTIRMLQRGDPNGGQRVKHLFDGRFS
jgi:hypothetical protein